MRPSLARRLVAEGLGTALLVAAVIGSGIMAERLAGGNVALALLANTIATGATLVALILTFGGVSGAHFNPVVTLVEWLGALPSGSGGFFPLALAVGYVMAQLAGGLLGAMAAHAMFAEPAWLAASTHLRAGGAQWFSEAVATFGLVAVIRGCGHRRPDATPLAVGLYIAGAYWFTASTSFANPAVTLARAFTPTFAGIRPADVAPFVVAQLAGGLMAAALFRWLLADTATASAAAAASGQEPV